MSINRSHVPDDDPDADELAARAPAWAQEHLEVLKDLRDMGMQLARNLTRRVLAETEAAEAAAEAGEPQPAPRRGAPIDPALSFSRISRAVRLTLALEARTHQAIEDAALRGAVANDDAPDSPDGPIDYESIRRRMYPLLHGETDFEIRRAVQETIEAAYDDPDEAQALKAEVKELLEEDEAFWWHGQQPIGETIALICQDLGLTPDWDRWETRAWARKEAAESPPYSPYATVARTTDPRYPNTGTQQYRKVRGLPPLEGPTPLRAARGPP